jgi:hypothetical protein
MTAISKDLSHRTRGKSAIFLFLFLAGGGLLADQLEMVNGDHYVGKVLSLNTNTVVWKSDILGTLNLPRDKVANITLGSAPSATLARPAARTNLQAKSFSLASPNNTAEGAAALSQLRSNSNLIHQVEAQFLGDADPAAKDKFNELMGGLISGKLNIGDIRAEAKSASDQLRSLKKDTGDSTGLLDSYLAILDKFVGETEASTAATTNKAASPAKPAPSLPPAVK